MSLFIPLLAACLGALLVLVLVGRGLGRLLRLPPREPYFDLFLALVLGVVGCSGSYALFCTHGRSILVPLLGLALLAAWHLRRLGPDEAPVADALARERSGWPAWATLLVFGLVVFGLRWLLLYDAASPYLRTPFQDYVYYGRLVAPLRGLGLETSLLDTLYPEFLTPMPYHYLELWLNTALAHASGLPAVWCLYLATYSALIAVVAVGFRAALAHFGVGGVEGGLLALGLVLVAGVFWPFFAGHSFLENGTLLVGTLLPVQPKLAPVYLLTMLGLLLLLRGRYLAAALVLAGLPLVFISTLPAVGAGLVGVALYGWRRRQLSGRAALVLLLPMGLAVAYIGAFYFLKAELFQFPGTGRAYIMASLVPPPGEWRTLLNIGLGTLVNFAVFYLPYGVVLALVSWAAWQRRAPRPRPARLAPVLAWAGSALLAAVATRAVGTHFLDSVQFFSNPVVPLLACLLALLLAAALARLARGWTAATAAALLLLAGINGYKLFSHNSPMHVTTRYSPEFLRQVGAALPALGNRGGYLLDDADYVSTYTLSPDSFTAGTYVSNFKSSYILTSLTALNPDSLTTDPRYARDSAQAEQGVRRSSLYRYAKFRALAGAGVSRDSTQYMFIKKFGLRFLCASRRASLPALLQPLVSATYTDALSGEKFYVLQ